jgi:hypothetical protein
MKNEKNYFDFFLNFHLTFIGITLWLKTGGGFRAR